MNREMNQKINDLDRARMLREEAEKLENRERVRARLIQLRERSEDPFYDRYVEQMMRDLENGKASPAQVEREAERSYQQYRQRMMQIRNGMPSGNHHQERPLSCQEMSRTGSREIPVHSAGAFTGGGNSAVMIKECITGQGQEQRNTLEFKVGAHVFSAIGAVFVLAAFVIFGFNFLDGLWQGLCLYGAALALVILPEILFRSGSAGLFKKRSNREGASEEGQMPARRKIFGFAAWFSCVITGIGAGGLYAANMINYLVLHVINETEAMLITLLIAVGVIFLSRRKESAAIRLIGLAGVYICFLPIREFDSELNFLIAAGILFVINVVSVFLPNSKNRMAVNGLQLFLAAMFMLVLVSRGWDTGISAIYLVLCVVTFFVFTNILSLRECMGEQEGFFPFCCIGNGFGIFLLFLIGNFGPGIRHQLGMVTFVHLTAEILVLAVCLVTFLLWNREDGRRWAQLYYGVITILILGAYYIVNAGYLPEVSLGGEYRWALLLSVLAAAALVKPAASHKEVSVLDGGVVLWMAIAGYLLSSYWYSWLIAAALLLSSLRIRRFYLYHELVISAGILAICWNQCYFLLFSRMGFSVGWRFPLSVLILLVLFLIFNHLPGLKDKKQLPYNIINLIFMVFYCLGVCFCRNAILSTSMMVLGTVAIIVMFRERYEMKIPRKYLILAGFLVYSSLTGHYGTPVAVSILLMMIALFCVGIGFKIQDKAERICGLVLAMCVCLKLVFYDFREVELYYRVALFLIVGVLALIISAIYARLEKNMERRELKEYHSSEGIQAVAEECQITENQNNGQEHDIENHSLENIEAK